MCTRSFRDDDRPAQLERDPHELVNLVGDADFMDVMADFTRDVLRRWDPDKTDAGVRSNQQDRALIDMAMRQGRFSALEYQPMTAGANQYMRNHLPKRRRGRPWSLIQLTSEETADQAVVCLPHSEGVDTERRNA